MNPRRALLLPALGTLLILAGQAANGAGRASALDTEPALARPITVEAVAEPLGELLPRLGRSLETTLEASRETQDEKVTLFAKERPAREILSRLAEFFDYSWVRKTTKGRSRLALIQDLPAKRRELAQRTSGPEQGRAALREALDGYVARVESPEARAVASQPVSVRLARMRELDLRINGTWERDENGVHRRDPMLSRDERKRLQQESTLLYQVTPEAHQFYPDTILRTLYRHLTPGEREAFWAGHELRFAYPQEREREALSPAVAHDLVAGGLGHLASPADAEPDEHVPFHSFQRVRVSVELMQDTVGTRATVNLRVIGRYGADDANSHGVEWAVRDDVDPAQWNSIPKIPEPSAEVKALSQPISIEPAKRHEPTPGGQPTETYATLPDLLPQVGKQVSFPLLADAYTESSWMSRLPTSLPLGDLLGRINKTFWRDVKLDRGYITLRHAGWADRRAAEPPIALVRRCRASMKRFGMLRFAESMEAAALLSQEQIDTLAWALHEDMPPQYHNTFIRDFEESAIVYRLVYALPPTVRKQFDSGRELPLAAWPAAAVLPLRPMILGSAGAGYENEEQEDGSHYQLGTGFKREDLLERAWLTTRVRLVRKPTTWVVTGLDIYPNEEDAQRLERELGYPTDPNEKPKVVQGDEIEVTFTVPGSEPFAHSFVDPKQVLSPGTSAPKSPPNPR